METAINNEIPVIKTNVASNFPFSVQFKATENWGTSSAFVTLEASMIAAKALKARNTTLPVRIEHNEGGHVVTAQLPVWSPRTESRKQPFDLALWCGRGAPPKVGDIVNLRINSLGSGVVEGYLVVEGFLGLMVRINEETRPAWHREQHPENPASAIYGGEIRYD